jgi:hypothetical protein
VSNAKEMLDKYGLSEYFFEHRMTDCNLFPRVFKQGVINDNIQTCHSSVANSSVLHLYKNVKNYIYTRTILRPCHTRLCFYCVCTALLNWIKRREIARKNLIFLMTLSFHGVLTAIMALLRSFHGVAMRFYGV